MRIRLRDAKQPSTSKFISPAALVKKIFIKRGAFGAPAIKQVRKLYSPTASDMHFVRDISFGRDMRYARRKKAANRISLRPAGAISLLRSKNITPSCARHITSQQSPPDRTPQGVTHYTLQARRVKRSTNKIVRTPFYLFGSSKPALW